MASTARPSSASEEAPRTRPSFVKSLFLGAVEEQLILPYPEFASTEKETLDLVVDSFTRFAAENIDPVRFDREAHYPRETIRGLAEIGMMGLIVPEEYEGLGMSQSAFCRAMEVVAGTDGATAVTIGAHLSIGMKAVLDYGTKEQKKRYLPRLASGDMIAAYALTEPGAGTDAQNLKTTAKETEDGKHFVLNGTKMWITNGGFADLFTVFARTGVEEVRGKKKNLITAFIVTRDMTGVSTGPDEDKLGIRASSTTTLNLEDVEVPRENVLGEIGQGFKIALDVLNDGRLSLAAGCVGAGKTLVREALGFAKSRQAFGRFISDFEMIQAKFAWIAIHLYVMESMVYLTAALCDRKDVDYSLESAACKVYCSERLWWIVNEALQVNGGNGFMRDLPYERALRDARINLIFEGTNEILRVLIALSGIQRSSEYLREIAEALKDPLHSLGVLSDFAARKIRRTVAPEGLGAVDAVLKGPASRLAESVVELADAVEAALRHHRKKIIERQFIQERVADMAIDIYAMAATLARTDSLIRRHGEEAAGHETRMCAAFVERAWRRVRRNARRVDFEADAPLGDIARETYARGGYRTL
ncbi:MAG: acyl-CoA dehydrogenase family protein [Acidobacteriota bacterium]